MDSNKSVFKRTRVAFSGVAVVVAGILLTYVSLSYYSAVNNSWKIYSEEAVELYSYHDQLVQALGYGGFIHSFKNLVLRKDIERHAPGIEHSLAVAREKLNLLESYGDYDATTVSDIRKTIDEYEIGYRTAISMIEAGNSSEQIDSVVIVNDTDALKALRQFDSEIRQRMEQEEALLSKQFTVAHNIQIFSAIIFIGLIAVYVSMVVKSSRKEFTLTNKALQSAEAKSTFLANMSHEIRTPMNGVMGTLQLLERDLPKGKNLLLVKKAIFSTRSLIQIINDVLDFSKIEAGELVMEEIDFSVSEIVESVNSDLLPKAITKKISLTFSISELTSDYWLGDPVRIRQIMLNLVSNAVKFTEKGGVEIIVSELDSEDTDGILIEVKDTGVGMSEQAVDNLFERFKQADESTTRKFGGTGLGMAITQNLIELMNGEIRVVSKSGEGTKFEVVLPLQKSSRSKIEHQEQADIQAPDLSGKAILVADDNDINRMIVVNMLECTNAKTICASDGVEAVNKYKNEVPNLILMDIQMPEMDGIEACLKIKALNEKVPIVALTANVMKEDVEAYRNAGFSGHLGKPLEINKLFKTLANHLT